MTRTDSRRVVLAVLTYRRPGDLADVLPLLVDQAESVTDDVDILVVDNDPSGQGAATAMAFGHSRVRAVIEPRPGIAAARNRALDESTESAGGSASAHSADLLVFIDDDERPQAGWLRNLLQTYDVDRPAGVVGPVVSEYEQQPDEWIAAGRFFDRRRLRTGTLIDVAATNNLLLDLAQVSGAGARFDERFGITGGSDTLFSRQLVARGGRLVWCDEAVVVDVVPTARLTREWVLRRAYRSGNSWSRTSLALADGRVHRGLARVRLTVKGLTRMIAGSARWAVGSTTHSLSQRVRGLRTMARGRGMVSGAFGGVYAEYARPNDASQPDRPTALLSEETAHSDRAVSS